MSTTERRRGYGLRSTEREKMSRPTICTQICRCHGSRFDVSSGVVLRGPAREPVKTHEIRVEDGNLELEG